MSVCTFFGHGDGYCVDKEELQSAIEDLISRGVDTFYVGTHGQFDGAVLSCLQQFQKIYPHIHFAAVLAYLPTGKQAYDPYAEYGIYPEGLEVGLPKFAIERRNKWMIDQSDYCLCFINHTWGGAYKFAKRAKNRGLTVINLGSAKL